MGKLTGTEIRIGQEGGENEELLLNGDRASVRKTKKFQK